MVDVMVYATIHVWAHVPAIALPRVVVVAMSLVRVLQILHTIVMIVTIVVKPDANLHVKVPVRVDAVVPVLQIALAHVTAPALAHAVRLATQHVLQPVWDARGHAWEVVKGLVCILVMFPARPRVSA